MDISRHIEPAIPCVRDQDATAMPARHMSETKSLNVRATVPRVIGSIPISDLTELSIHMI